MREFERRTTVAGIAAARVEMAGWYGGIPDDTLCAPLAALSFARGRV